MDTQEKTNTVLDFDKNFVITIVAPRGSGKSYMTRMWLLEHSKKYDYIFIFCPSIQYNHDYDDVNGKQIYKMHDMDEFGAIFDEQARCKAMVVDHKRVGGEGTIRCPKTLFVLDDIIDSGVLNFKGPVDKIAERGRHLDISVIIMSQRLSAVSRSIRLNSDYFIIFSPFSISDLEQFLEQFVSRQFRKELRIALEKLFETKYQFLLLDNSESDWKQKFKTSHAQQFVQGKYDFMQIKNTQNLDVYSWVNVG